MPSRIACFLLAAAFSTSLLGTSGPAAAEETGTATEEPAHAGVKWEPDFNKAKEKAKAEKKHLVLNFTGSDWCGWCKKLESEVFGQAAFAKDAETSFVFVFLDAPHAPDLKAKVVDAELIAQLASRYGVAGYPTIMVTFADGTPYAQTGYQKGGPSGYLEHLQKLKKSSEPIAAFLAKKDKLTAADLVAGLTALEETGISDSSEYTWAYDRIPELDPTGEHGLLPRYKQWKVRQVLDAVIEDAQANGGAPSDWSKVAETLVGIDVAMLEGNSRYTGIFANLTFGAARWHLENGNFEAARAGANRVRALPMLADNPQAQEVIGEFLQSIDKAEAAKNGGTLEPDADDTGGDETDGDDASDE